MSINALPSLPIGYEDITSELGSLTSSFDSTASTFADSIKSNGDFCGLFGTIGDFLPELDIGNGLQSLASIGQEIKDNISGIIGNVSSVLSNITSKINGMLSNITSLVGDKLTSYLNSIQSVVGGIVSAISSSLSAISSSLSGLITQMENLASNLAGGLRLSLSIGCDAVSGGISGVTGAISDTVDNLVGGVTGSIDGVKNIMGDALNNPITNLSSGAASAKSSALSQLGSVTSALDTLPSI